MTTKIIIGVVLLLIVLIVLYIHFVNELQRCIVKIDEASSDIDVALSKRYNVLKKMAQVVDKYTNHERQLLIEIVNIRKGMSVNEKLAAEEALNANYKNINLVAEGYPELLSNEVYQNLQNSITDTEEHLQASRRFFNSAVSKYNQYVVTFPTSIIANKKQMTKREFYEAPKEELDVELFN